ncbi:hypothetical protein T492DRAFT_837929 [Pavlovales sp. CCMP2436]|nr:hypothetical protein T492DRAFT_837929 [Pavlovales sp. CCMP2436]
MSSAFFAVNYSAPVETDSGAYVEAEDVPGSPSDALARAGFGDEDEDTPVVMRGGSPAEDQQQGAPMADEEGGFGGAPAEEGEDAPPDGPALEPPKKPLSAYFLFMKDARASGQNVSEAGKSWSAMSADEQSGYNETARVAKADYAEALAAFKAAGGIEHGREHAVGADAHPALPMAIVAKHMKFDPDVSRCSKEAMMAMQHALTLFLTQLGDETSKFAARTHGRKIVGTKDLLQTIEQYHLKDAFGFLDGELAAPEEKERAAPKKRKAKNADADEEDANEDAPASADGPAADEAEEEVMESPAAGKRKRGAQAQVVVVPAGARITSFFQSAPRPVAGLTADSESESDAPETDDEEDDAPVRKRAPPRRRMLDDLEEDADDMVALPPKSAAASAIEDAKRRRGRAGGGVEDEEDETARPLKHKSRHGVVEEDSDEADDPIEEEGAIE